MGVEIKVNTLVVDIEHYFVDEKMVMLRKYEMKPSDLGMAGVFEERIQREIALIRARIKELESEQAALERQLSKARSANVPLSDVNRKNSLNRATAEATIISALKQAQKPLSLDKLYGAVVLVNSDLKRSTFRTYLYRMKEKGMLENVDRGFWKLHE
jgi:hypothetical protein